jgi:hypothetical protein
MLVAQVMEDAWLGAQLDTFWSHPLNQGWMHYFQRWASTPSFRRWWPIIRPVYSQGFADFVRDRFDLQLRDTQSGRDSKGPGAKLTLINMEQPEQLTEGLAGQHWKRRYGEIPHQDKSVLLYLLELEQVPNAASVPPLQVGFLLYSAKVEDGRKIIEWATPHLFVPHSLIGAGIVARFLDALIARFCSFDGVEELQVRYDEISGPQPGRGDPARALRRFRRDAASRLERVSTINFYKSRGFLYMRPDQTGELTRLSLDLQLARAERATRTRQESSAVPIPPGGLSASRHGTTANI